ncbi:MAG: aminoacyl-tRNA hydrolase [Fimbriimonadaceae bacterium]|nr:aminoacyl-tRNA hydrolase [Fimbriimonadaceae bacterium]
MSFLRKKQPVVHPVRLVVGLGNPGPQYRRTRHNVGFDVVEALADRHKVKMDLMRHQAQIGLGEVAGVAVALLKPLTYMNLSGRAVGPVARHYGVKPEDILVVADDLDLPTGKVRMRAKGSSGGHNGHKSMIEALGTTEYPRLKIGIGRSDDATVDHVLSRFHKDERALIDDAVAKCVKAVEVWLADGYEAAALVANSGEPGG